MELQRQTSRKLHEEHVAVLGLLERFGRYLAGREYAAGGPADAAARTLLAQLGGALEHEITRHFDLEEQALFPRLRERGEGDLVDMLLEEHVVVRDLARRLIPLIARVRDGALDATGRQTFKRLGLDLAESLGSHAEKEQGSLVPAVDEMLDEATDMEIWNKYAI